MWLDAETDIDFVNFGSVAISVAELIVQANGEPLSIGVSGPWGVGKSSLIKLTKSELARRQPTPAEGKKAQPNKYVFVEFNAWLYQGYDDARAALMEAIATKLEEVAKERETGLEKTQEFLRRIDWFRVAGLTATSLATVALGLPPGGLLGQIGSWWGRTRSEGVDTEAVEGASDIANQAIGNAKSVVKDVPYADESPRQKIQALRDSFVEALEELDITLVVLIDDLDRCLPETAVSTLEAIRLFLFLPGTAFVIAADDQMIKHAVKKHFDHPDDTLVTNYFDKLIQIPIRVPTLGTQEVRAYMFLLYINYSTLEDGDREKIRVAVCERLSKSWQGLRIDSTFVRGLGVALPPELVAQLDTADRLTTIMTTASGIRGNPRLIKRFLNALSVRMAVAKAQGVAVDEAALAKLLLFERLAPEALYAELARDITNSVDGRSGLLAAMEPTSEDADPAAEEVDANAEVAPAETTDPVTSLPESWSLDFAREWLALPPRLADIDMRGALYVSREYLPVVTAEDGLSSTAAELLKALIEEPGEAGALESELRELLDSEHTKIFGRLLDIARKVETWGVPDILRALLVLIRVKPDLGGSLSGFLGSRPASQIQPDIVPRVIGEPWAQGLVDAWKIDPDISSVVKNAIDRESARGNVTK
jgi:predicted KAP-like P-loop ATPase